MRNVLPSSLPLGRIQPLPLLREGLFFRSRCPFCLFPSAREFKLVCILYIHTHTPHIPHLLLSQDSLRWIYFCLVMQLPSLDFQEYSSLSSLSSLPFSTYQGNYFPSLHCQMTQDMLISMAFALQWMSLYPPTAVRGVQGAAGKLRPTGGRPFTDWETMEETGRGHHSHCPQGARQAASSPSSSSPPCDLGFTSQPCFFHQEASSLFQMPRWPFNLFKNTHDFRRWSLWWPDVEINNIMQHNTLAD